MTKDNMTIRFAPDGFSFIDVPDAATSALDLATSALLDEAPFHEVTPGPDFQQRLHEAVLGILPERETPPDLTVELLSERVVILPPDTAPALAESMYRATLSEAASPEHVLLQPLALPSGQRLILSFSIDRELYLFLERNCGELCFVHHLASLLQQAAPVPSSQSGLAVPVSPSQAASGGTALLAARCLPQFLELALFRDGQLVLANIYPTSQPDNRRYYVLNTWLRTGLDQLHDRLLILGNGDPAAQLHQDLRPFIKQITI